MARTLAAECGGSGLLMVDWPVAWTQLNFVIIYRPNEKQMRPGKVNGGWTGTAVGVNETWRSSRGRAMLGTSCWFGEEAKSSLR